MVFTVLLVEDSPDDVLFMTRALRKAPVAHAVRVVEDGQQALDYLAGAHPYADRGADPLPDLVLLDLKLPRVPGLDVLRWIRAQAELARTRVVVLSSSDHAEDLRQAHVLGADLFLTKPGDPAELPALMAGVFRRFFP